MPSCKHIENDCYHTCSLDDSPQYCVYCLWEKTYHLKPDRISIYLFDLSINDISWDGITVEEIWKPSDDSEVKKHHKRIVDANLLFPILIFPTKNDKYQILDGCHRFVKAVKLLNLENINCVIVPVDILDQCTWDY